MKDKEILIIKINASNLSPEDKRALTEILLNSKNDHGEFLKQLLRTLNIGKEVLTLFGINDGCG